MASTKEYRDYILEQLKVLDNTMIWRENNYE